MCKTIVVNFWHRISFKSVFLFCSEKNSKTRSRKNVKACEKDVTIYPVQNVSNSCLLRILIVTGSLWSHCTVSAPYVTMLKDTFMFSAFSVVIIILVIIIINRQAHSEGSGLGQLTISLLPSYHPHRLKLWAPAWQINVPCWCLWVLSAPHCLHILVHYQWNCTKVVNSAKLSAGI